MDFLRFFFHNSYTQTLFFIFPLIFLALIEGRFASAFYEIFFLAALALLAVALLQTLMLFNNKKLLRYKDLAKLLLVTKEVEKELELFGGYGKGVFEKAKSLSGYIPPQMLQEIFILADCRNKAMHGDPLIENAPQQIANAKNILARLQKMHSSSYLLKVWSARVIMVLIVSVAAFIFFNSFAIGQALFFTLLSYLIQAFLVYRYGYVKYITLILILFISGVAFILYLQGMFSNVI